MVHVIEHEPGGGIQDLEDEEIQEAFKSAGALLFRGFDFDPQRMMSFARRFSTRFNGDQSRPSVDGTDGKVHLVTEGMGYVAPHSEQANSPFRPDAIWFCCEIPADAGGETLLWDGIEVWEAMGGELKDLFSSKKLRFFQRYARERWTQFLGEGATLAEATHALDEASGVSYFVGPEESIYLEFVCPAVVKTRYGGDDAFVNSLLLEYRTLEARSPTTEGSGELSATSAVASELMSFDDGSPIAATVIDAVDETVEGLAEEIAWQPGDLAMIDNTRFLHGRNGFTDTRRRLYSCCSFLEF